MYLNLSSKMERIAVCCSAPGCAFGAARYACGLSVALLSSGLLRHRLDLCLRYHRHACRGVVELAPHNALPQQLVKPRRLDARLYRPERVRRVALCVLTVPPCQRGDTISDGARTLFVIAERARRDLLQLAVEDVVVDAVRRQNH